jgi:hypothetical protein
MVSHMRHDEPMTGVFWPAGQALPQFAAPTALDVLDLAVAPEAEVLLATTAQGVVNRRRPRIWLLREADEGARTWLDTIGLPASPVAGAEALVSRHRGDIRGAVLADPAVPATRNVATTLAGLENAVVADPAVAERLGLPVLADLRDRFGDDRAAYRWAVDQLWPRTTHRMLIGLAPDNPGFLRDYAVANRAFVIGADPGDRRERALLERLLADMPSNSPYLGWWPADVSGESGGTELTSRHGVYVVAADFSLNLTVFGGVRATTRPVPPLPAPPLEPRTYLTFTMTDGDNLQYCQHRMRQIWDTPERGLVPLNWTVSPLLRDAAPAILTHYQHTATGNDLLIAGPSGAGYAYPTPWPDHAYPAFTEQTGRYARDSGLPIVNVLNRVAGRDRDLAAGQVAAYARDMRPAGILQHWTNRHSIAIVAGLPVATSQLVGTRAECRALLANTPRIPDRPGPRFISIGILAWSMTPADVAALVAELDERYRVVRGDQFFQLVRIVTTCRAPRSDS